MAGPPIPELLRRQLGTAIRRVIVGEGPVVRDLTKPIAGDAGLFGPHSVTWKVHADAAMLIGGVRALLLQTIHPLAIAGVTDHSAYKDDPTGRLWRTSRYVGTVTFGTTEEAKNAVAMVKRVHEGVVGTAPDGRPYAANDPHLLGWVHHTLVDSFLRAHQRYARTALTLDDSDRYVSEQSRLADLFGADDPAPARSVAELQTWLREIRPELEVGQQAREATRFLLFPPLHNAARAPYAIIASAAVGLLPARVRRALGIRALPFANRLAVEPAAKTLIRVVGWALTPRSPSAVGA